uniref:Pectinesterase inhibitor domain-containing protein n=1 Tax=Triticum urartu TaxID=4572 RepID=A0A8R7QVL5_TRIUA
MLLSTILAVEASDSGGGNPKVTNFMVEACKNASKKNQYYDPDPMTQEFCVSTLKLDNRSVEAKDLHGLVLVAIEILKGQVAVANGNVKQMLHNTKNGTVAMFNLSFCVVDYDRTVSILNICDTMINEYHGGTGGANDGSRSSALLACLRKLDEPLIDIWLRLPDNSDAEKLPNDYDAVGKLVKLNFCLASTI